MDEFVCPFDEYLSCIGCGYYDFCSSVSYQFNPEYYGMQKVSVDEVSEIEPIELSDGELPF